MDVKKFNLTGVQEDILDSELFFKNASLNNITEIVHLDDKINVEAMNLALNYFIRDNDSTRLCYNVDKDGNYFQYSCGKL